MWHTDPQDETTGRCSCRRAGLPCTSYCACDDGERCDNSHTHRQHGEDDDEEDSAHLDQQHYETGEVDDGELCSCVVDDENEVEL